MRRVALGLLVAVAGCTPPAPPPRPQAAVAEPDGPGPRVLFVGNSLTGGHNLPWIVKAICTAGGSPINVRAVTPGGVSLEDQWGGEARTVLQSAKWDRVVLQQGPSSRDDSRANLREWAGTWAMAARVAGASPGLYMVWPVQGQVNGFELVGRSYREAAEAAGADLFPVGEAWQASIQLDPNVALYTDDNLHPTPAGSYLAALVIAQGLTGVPPSKAPAKLDLAGGPFEIPEATAATLRRAAAAVARQK